MNQSKLFGKGLVIQITRDETRIALMPLGSSAPQILHSVILPTPEGAVEDGVIQDHVIMRELLKSALSAPEFKRVRRAVFVLCTTQVIAETVTTPDIPESKLEKLLLSNVDMYFPVDITDYRLIWQPVGSKNDSGELKEQLVQLWAVPKAMLAQYYALANECGLSILAVDYCGHSIATAIGAGFSLPTKAKKGRKKLDLNKEISLKRKKAPEPDIEPQADTAVAEEPEVDLHLTMERQHLMMTFVQNGCVKLQRLIQWGSDPAEQANEIMMALEYYRAMEQEGIVRSGILSGALAEDKELADMLESLLYIPIRTLSSQLDLTWCVCQGASCTAMDFGDPALNHPKKHRAKRQLGSAWQYGFVAVSGAVLAMVLVITMGSRSTWSSSLSSLDTTALTLRIQAQQTAGFADNYYNYSNQYDNYSADWDTVFASLNTYNDNLVLALNELESVIPATTTVTQLSISADGLSLQFSSPTKEEAAYLIIALRDLEYAPLDTVSNLSGGGGGASAPSMSVEAPPTEGGDYNIDPEVLAELMQQAAQSNGSSVDAEFLQYMYTLDIDAEKLKSAVASLTPEQLIALEAAYGAIPEVDHTIEELVREADFEQRENALREMLTTNPFAAYRFLKLVEEDMLRPAGTEILYDYIADDIVAEGNQQMLLDIISGNVKDADTMLEYMDRLVDILTKDEETLAATEALICTDPVVKQWYIYYLEVAMELRDPDEIPYLDMEKIVSDIMSGQWPNTEDEELNAILRDLIPPYSGGTGEGPGSNIDISDMPEDVLEDLTDWIANGSDTTDIPDSVIDYINGTPDSSPSEEIDISDMPEDVRNDLLEWIANGSDTSNIPDSVLDYFMNGGGSSSSTDVPDWVWDVVDGSEDSETTEPEDTNYHFSVTLRYQQALIDAEMQRKGLSYEDKLPKVEVDK